jgi:aspartate kinase
MRILKFGGATVATPDRIKQVARRVATHVQTGERVIVVVSAMGNTTKTLLDLARQVSPSPQRRELDMLLSVGERMTMSLMAMALNDLNIPAVSLTGSQAGIVTTEDHENADILEIKPLRIEQYLAEGKTVIIAGFQGVSQSRKEITTLGRGGSDLTAVALAAHFKCPCEIVKEIASIYQADPKLFPRARPIKEIDYTTLELMTQWGSQMLNSKAAALAKAKSVHLFFSSATGDNEEGTRIIRDKDKSDLTLSPHISHRRALLKFTSQISECHFEDLIKKVYEKKNISYPEILWSSVSRSGIEGARSHSSSKIFWAIDHPDTAENHLLVLRDSELGSFLDRAVWMCFSLIQRNSLCEKKTDLEWPTNWHIQFLKVEEDFKQTLIFFPEDELGQAIQRIQDCLTLG